MSVLADVKAATLFISNFRFVQNAIEYFTMNDYPSPALHFWSLSIEEQFYIAVPLIFLVLRYVEPKRRSQLFSYALCIIFVVSFAFYVSEGLRNANLAFFRTETRVWQLAFGGLVGTFFERSQKLAVPLRVVFAYGGSMILVTALCSHDGPTAFTGLWAILPTLAGGLLIIGSPTTGLLKSILSCRPVASIGDLSYSLYLWHWPVLVIGAERWSNSSSATPISTLAFVLLALFSYRFVEAPVRASSLTSRPLWKISYGVLGILFVYLLASVAAFMPLSSMTSARSVEIERASVDFSRLYKDKCHLDFDSVAQRNCEYGDGSGARTALLFGDSHAAQWFDAIEHAASDSGWKLLSRTKTSCPATNVSIWTPSTKLYYESCDIWRRNIMTSLAKNPPDVVFIGNYSHYDGWLYDGASQSAFASRDSSRIWNRGLRDLVSDVIARGSHVVLIRDNPRMLQSYKACLQTSDACGRDKASALAGMEDDLASIADSYRGSVSILDLTTAICDDNWCPATRSNTIIYQDQHHLTASYAGTFWKVFQKYLTAPKRVLISPGTSEPQSSSSSN